MNSNNEIKVVEENIVDIQHINKNVEIENKEKIKNKKKKNKKKIALNIITTVLFVFILVEAAIGIINMQRINNEEEPIWYLSTKTTETELKTETEYNLGLYKIVKTDTARETKITLKPFFLSN